VNPDGVISNAASFGITVPTPAIAGVVPSAVATGTSTVLQVSATGSPGTGFTSGSACRLSGPGIAAPGRILPSGLSGGQLECVLDTATVASNVYSLVVVSETGAVSNAVSVTVTPSDPVVYAVDPSSGTTVVSFAVNGARLDPATARVLFFRSPTVNTDPAALVPTSNAAPVDANRIFVSDFQLPSTAGQYSVAVRTGAGTAASPFRYSNAVAFSVGTAAVVVSGFQPPTAYQGEPAVALTFTGAQLPQDSTVEIEPPGSSTFTPLTSSASGCSGTPATCTTVTATKSLVQSPGVPEPEGQWLVRLRFGSSPSDPTSAPWPLRVLSNQAILRDYAATPAPAQGGTVGSTKTSLTFAVSNLRGPAFDQIRIVLEGPVDAAVKTARTLTPSPTPDGSSTALAAGPLDLAGLETGTYAFTVRNPNATPSNALPFAVTAGAPTLVSPICVKGTSCQRSALQSDTPVTLRLVGTNFSRPDANGNGSTVVVAADFSAGFPLPDPCAATTGGTQFQAVAGPVTVVDSTAIDVQVDTRNAYVDPSYGTTYYVAVWNPGGASGQQKSSCGVTVNAANVPWFRLCATAACAQ
jgi:hypothetical protein